MIKNILPKGNELFDVIKPKKFYPHIHCQMKIGGVYMLFLEKELQYVGSSINNVGNRLWNHDKDKFFEFDSLVIIPYIEKDVPLDFRLLEKDIIAHLQPKYNVLGKCNSGRYRGRYRGKKISRHEQTMDF